MNDDNLVNIEDEMTDAGKVSGPRVVKGGTFAPTDIKLIKKTLEYYLHKHEQYGDLPEAEGRHIANLLHRLNNRI